MASKALTRTNVVNAAIYCRISRDTEDNRLGVERQQKDCRKLCADRGWNVAGLYVDNDISAADPKKMRPEYERLIKDIEAGNVDAVVVWSEDRLHRRPSELESFVTACETAGMAQLASVGGDVNLNDPGALMVLRIKGSVAAYEVDHNRERIKRKMLEKAQAGEPHGGSRPFGYKDDKITVNKPEATLIRKAAQRIIEGVSLRAIAKDWNERGIRSTRGNVFFDTQVKAILTSPRVAGLREHQGGVIGKAVWPAILDEATWKQVCTILKDPARRMPRASQSYPLRGIATCAICGQFLHANPRSEGRRYRCRKEGNIGCGGVSVNADQLERLIFDIVLPLADTPAFKDILRSEDEDIAKQAGELVQANSEDQAMLSQLEDDYADKVVTRQAFLRQSQRLSERIEARDAQLVTLRGHSALDRLGGGVQAKWDFMSADDKRTIIQSLVARIEVAKATNLGSHVFDPGRVTMEWRSGRILLGLLHVDRSVGVLLGRLGNNGITDSA